MPRRYGGLPFPVAEGLIPAGSPQYHLGTDVGGPAAGLSLVADARTNVGIYNASDIEAMATVEVRCGSGDANPDYLAEAAVSTSTVPVPANSLVQTRVLSSAAAAGCNVLQVSAPYYYVIVTVDQPSLSYVTSLANDLPVKFPGVIPVTH